MEAQHEPEADFDEAWAEAFGDLEEEVVNQADQLLQQQADSADQEQASQEPAQDVLVLPDGAPGDERYEEDMEDEIGDEAPGEGQGEGEVAAQDEAEDETSLSIRQEQERERNERIIESLTEEQNARYEAYRRSKLPVAKMRKLLQQILGVQSLSDKALVAMCGIGKMFVGDLIELARHQAASEGHSGPLLPRHVQRAYQMLDSAERVPHPLGTRKRMFR